MMKVLRPPVRHAVSIALFSLGVGHAWAEPVSIDSLSKASDGGGAPGLVLKSTGASEHEVKVSEDGRIAQVIFHEAEFGPAVQGLVGDPYFGDVHVMNDSGNAIVEVAIPERYDLVQVEHTEAGYRLTYASQNRGMQAKAMAVSIKDMSFRRSKTGGGLFELVVDGSVPELDVNRGMQRLVVDLRGSNLPARFERRLDVLEFGSPIWTIDSYQRGKDTRLAFTMQDDQPFDYSTYQLGNKLLVEVIPAEEEKVEDMAMPGKPYTGSKFSMDFQAIDIRNALQVIADFTSLNIVVADNVSGTLTMRLKDVPWDQALDVILQSKGLGMKREGNVIWVAPESELIAADEARMKAEATKRQFEPLTTELVQIHYADASDLAELLRSASQGSQTTSTATTRTTLEGEQTQVTRSSPLADLLGGGAASVGNTLLSERGAVTVDTRTNSLLLKETPSNLENIKSLISLLDRPVKQILIEARIVIARENAREALGVRWGGAYTERTNYDWPYTVDVSGAYGGGQTGTGTGAAVPSTIVNLPVADGSAIGFRLGSLLGDKILDLELSALESADQLRIVSSPRVIAADNKPALIEQGEEIPYKTTAPNGATTVAFKKAVLGIEVTPRITPDGRVNLKILAKKDSRGETVVTEQGEEPAIDTRKVDTSVLVTNGETVVIGGIYEETMTDVETGVPGLKDVPVLGHLFKTTTDTGVKSEILIFLTPKVLTGVGAIANANDKNH